MYRNALLLYIILCEVSYSMKDNFLNLGRYNVKTLVIIISEKVLLITGRLRPTNLRCQVYQWVLTDFIYNYSKPYTYLHEKVNI